MISVNDYLTERYGQGYQYQDMGRDRFQTIQLEGRKITAKWYQGTRPHPTADATNWELLTEETLDYLPSHLHEVSVRKIFHIGWMTGGPHYLMTVEEEQKLQDYVNEIDDAVADYNAIVEMLERNRI